jgi:hypothetical protein
LIENTILVEIGIIRLEKFGVKMSVRIYYINFTESGQNGFIYFIGVRRNADKIGVILVLLNHIMQRVECNDAQFVNIPDNNILLIARNNIGGITDFLDIFTHNIAVINAVFRGIDFNMIF